MGGISHAVDVYAPDHSGDEQFHQVVIDQFQKVNNINDLKSDHTVVEIVNIIIQDTMAFVMQITAVIMGIVFLLTLRLQNANIKKQ